MCQRHTHPQGGVSASPPLHQAIRAALAPPPPRLAGGLLAAGLLGLGLPALGLELAALDGRNGFTLNGIAPVDSAGFSVSGAGDVNGDGIDDLFIGAPSADPYGRPFAGQSYVVFGHPGGFPARIELAALDGHTGFALNGIAGGAGRSVSAAGDINGDGVDDLLIGAPGADPDGRNEAGQSYVVFGRRVGFPAQLELAALDGRNGFTLNGIAPVDRAGFSVSGAGDVNGDGIDDLLVGTPFARPGGKRAAGQSYVVFGRTGGFPARIELAGLDGHNGFVLNGIAPETGAGASVSGAGDVNGDGLDDLFYRGTGHLRWRHWHCQPDLCSAWPQERLSGSHRALRPRWAQWLCA